MDYWFTASGSNISKGIQQMLRQEKKHVNAILAQNIKKESITGSALQWL